MVMRHVRYGDGDLGPILRRSSIDYAEAYGAAKEIVEAVKAGGDAALRGYALKFDRYAGAELKVSKGEITAAVKRVDGGVIRSLKSAAKNIGIVHRAQAASMRRKWRVRVCGGVEVGERWTPIGSVGCYVPGGRAAYPSTVLMSAVPAKIAGVKRVVVASPPPIPDVVLAACSVAGVDEAYMMGGAQAVAALAYGTESVGRVDKIVGPGNRYVTAAKMIVYGTVDVDMPAGPSEILVIADGGANPAYIAADMLAQAEHDPNAQCVLATDSEALAERVVCEVAAMADASDKKAAVSQSLSAATVVLTRSLAESVAFANEYAAEHLEIHTRSPERVADRIVNAGAVFIGPYAPVAAGDYASGGNHVLPTGGAARFKGQLSVRDFMKTTSVQRISKAGLRRLAPAIMSLARKEGLTEHAKSVTARLG